MLFKREMSKISLWKAGIVEKRHSLKCTNRHSLRTYLKCSGETLGDHTTTAITWALRITILILHRDWTKAGLSSKMAAWWISESLKRAIIKRTKSEIFSLENCKYRRNSEKYKLSWKRIQLCSNKDWSSLKLSWKKLNRRLKTTMNSSGCSISMIWNISNILFSNKSSPKWLKPMQKNYLRSSEKLIHWDSN